MENYAVPYPFGVGLWFYSRIWGNVSIPRIFALYLLPAHKAQRFIDGNVSLLGGQNPAAGHAGDNQNERRRYDVHQHHQRPHGRDDSKEAGPSILVDVYITAELVFQRLCNSCFLSGIAEKVMPAPDAGIVSATLSSGKFKNDKKYPFSHCEKGYS